MFNITFPAIVGNVTEIRRLADFLYYQKLYYSHVSRIHSE